MADKVIKKGLPPWMGTFADLCTLLLTFFVLLLTFANMDVIKFREMLGSVQEAFGVQTKMRGEYQAVKLKEDKESAKEYAPIHYQPATSLRGPSADQEAQDAAEAAAMAREIRNLVDSQGMSQAVDVKSGKRGVRLRVKSNLFFDAGSAEVKSDAAKLLKGVSQVMSKSKYYLTVEGHTDSQPIHTDQFPSNWELSSMRASAVLRQLVADGVPEGRVSAIGYAANYPLAPNASAEGRNKNRRVEFVFTKRPFRVAVD